MSNQLVDYGALVPKESNITCDIFFLLLYSNTQPDHHTTKNET